MLTIARKPDKRGRLSKPVQRNRGASLAALLIGTSMLTPVLVWPSPARASCTVNPGTPPPDYVIGDTSAIVNLEADCPGAPTGIQSVEVPAGVVVDRSSQVGAIQSDGSAIWTVTNNGMLQAIGDTVLLLGDGHTVANAGSIASGGGNAAVHLGGDGTITNHVGASILGHRTITSSGALTLDNAGSIAATGNGINAGSGTSITNRAGATISGYNTIRQDSAPLGSTLTVDNAGVIHGGNFAILAAWNGDITNHAGATISGLRSGALIAGNALTLDNAGDIVGPTAAIASDAWAVSAGEISNLVNHATGTITGANGVRSSQSATINNFGLIQGELNGIASGSMATIVNAGDIVGTARYGIETISDATITNDATGTITGGQFAVVVGRDLVMDNAGLVDGFFFGLLHWGEDLTVTNSGIIRGHPAIQSLGGGTKLITNEAGGNITGSLGIRTGFGSTTIVNAGTITGTGTTAIQTGIADDTLEMHAGSRINGRVDVSSGTDTLRLGGSGTADFFVSSIGTQFTGFEVFEKTGYGRWRLFGDNATLATDWAVNEGDLEVHGDMSSTSFTVAPGASMRNYGDIDNYTVFGFADSNLGNTISGTVTVESGGVFIGLGSNINAIDVQNGGAAVVVSNVGVVNGPVTVGGTLINSQSFIGDVTVEDGGIYRSDGTSATVTVESGGTLRTGANDGVIATMGTVGDLSSAGTIEIDVDGAGNSDLIYVFGTVDITGSTLDARMLGDVAGMPIETSHLIIFNGGTDPVVGTFTDGTGLNTAGDLFTVANTTAGDGNDVALDIFRTGLTLADGETNAENVAFPTGFPGFVFTVDGSDHGLFSGTMGESATTVDVTKTGSGTLELTGMNSFTGMTTVDAGSLINNGTLAAPVTVNDGALYGGIGISGDLTARNGGTIAPGNSIGALIVNGDVTFDAGSVYSVEVAPDLTSDLLVATGAVTIDPSGTQLDVTGLPGDYPDTATFAVINAGSGVTGSFETVTDNLPDIDLEAIYLPSSVQLTYVKAGSEPTVSEPPATSDLSPKEIHPSAQAAAMDATVDFSKRLRLRGARHADTDGPSGQMAGLGLGFLPTQPGRGSTAVGGATTTAPQDLTVWGAAMASTSSVNSSGGVAGWDGTTNGLAFGFEHRFDGLPTIAGIAIGYSNSDVTSGAASADIDSWHVGVYGAAGHGPLTLSGAAAFAWHSYSVDRFVALNDGGSVNARGSSEGYTLTASGEAFYDMAGYMGITGFAAMGEIRFGPLATIDTIHTTRTAFAETEAGVLNLSVDGSSSSQTFTGLGVGIGADHTIGSTQVSFDTRIAWEHVFGDRSVASTATIPVAGATFVDQSAAIGRNRVTISAGATIALSDRLSTHFQYDGVFSQSTNGHRASAGLTVKF